MEHSASFCFGTAKLDMPNYGFSSRPAAGQGDTPLALLRTVETLGIRHLDTSPRYGNSEVLIGEFLRGLEAPLAGAFEVATKIDELASGDAGSAARMRASLFRSIDRLGGLRPSVVYLHQNELDILRDSHVLAGARSLRSEGLIRRFGASIYSMDELEHCLQSTYFDVIQAPVSVFDTKFYLRARASRTTKAIVARSLFLQGLLLNRSEIESRVRQAAEIRAYLARLDYLATRHGLGLLEMAAGFVFSLPGIEQVIVGTSSDRNLGECLQAARTRLPESLVHELLELGSSARDWTNPRNWR